MEQFICLGSYGPYLMFLHMISNDRYRGSDLARQLYEAAAKFELVRSKEQVVVLYEVDLHVQKGSCRVFIVQNAHLSVDRQMSPKNLQDTFCQLIEHPLAAQGDDLLTLCYQTKNGTFDAMLIPLRETMSMIGQDWRAANFTPVIESFEKQCHPMRFSCDDDEDDD